MQPAAFLVLQKPVVAVRSFVLGLARDFLLVTISAIRFPTRDVVESQYGRVPSC